MHIQKGILSAIIILLLWSACLVFAFSVQVEAFTWWLLPLILLQTHLCTGLFITAHDAMHGTVSSKKRINNLTGWICAGLFAYNFYPFLYKKHHAHHRFVATEDDPDYHTGNFFQWYFSFLKNYINIWQFLLMAVTFNLLLIFIPQWNLLLFWIIPSLLSTLQLFYFGTYLPHKGAFPEGNRHHAGSLQKNHFLAFLSCYFFGYHYEHHDAPGVPWWQLYRRKN